MKMCVWSTCIVCLWIQGSPFPSFLFLFIGLQLQPIRLLKENPMELKQERVFFLWYLFFWSNFDDFVDSKFSHFFLHKKFKWWWFKSQIPFRMKISEKLAFKFKWWLLKSQITFRMEISNKVIFKFKMVQIPDRIQNVTSQINSNIHFLLLFAFFLMSPLLWKCFG